MAEPYTDEELAAWLAVYPPVISNTDARWRPTIERLLSERDRAIDDAAFLAQCAAQLLHGGDELLEECRETVLDELQRLMRRRFDVLRVADVMSRYADVEPVTVQEQGEAEVAHD